MTLATAMQEQPSLLDAALAYAKRGWKVFPVRGKLPLVNKWEGDGSTTDETQIREWFEDPIWEFDTEDPATAHTEEIGIGLVTGNGVVVLDLDTKGGRMEDMIETVARLTEAKEFDAPTVRTGGGGLHFFFATDVPLRNKTGVLRGVDVRGDGGFVVAPPSIHASGRRYEWLDWPLPDILPSWPFSFHSKPTVAATEIVEGQPVVEGARNDFLTKKAGIMRRRGSSELAIRAALMQENLDWCRPPLEEAEVRAVAHSVARYTPEDPIDGTQDPETGSYAVSAVEFINQVSETAPWLLEDVIPEDGIGFIIGPPKVFKSFFALEMAFAIATGVPFLGMFKVPEPRTVLYIQEESGKAAWKQRIIKATSIYGEAHNLFLISNRPYHLEDKQGFERLRTEIEARRPALTILDPLASFIKGDENSQQPMGELVRSLRTLRNAYHTAFLIVHHSKKDKPQEFRGSSVFYAASEVTIRMWQRDKNVPRSSVTFELKDGEAPPKMDVRYRQATGSLQPITVNRMLAEALGAPERDEDPHYNR